MSGFLNMLLAHGYTAEQGTATGAYLCALHLMGYVVESEYDAELKIHKINILKFHDDHIDRIGGAQNENLASALVGALRVVRESLGAEEFTRQLHALSPGAFENDN